MSLAVGCSAEVVPLVDIEADAHVRVQEDAMEAPHAPRQMGAPTW